MKRMYRVALMLGLGAAIAAPVGATETDGPDRAGTNEIYVVNNHGVSVRVYAEDAQGKLHRLGRVARGSLKAFQIPDDISAQDFRIKVFPSPAGSEQSDDYGVKTNVLDVASARQVTLWLESDLSRSVVEIDRG